MQGLASFSVLEHLPGAGFYAQRSKRAGWEPMSLQSQGKEKHFSLHRAPSPGKHFHSRSLDLGAACGFRLGDSVIFPSHSKFLCKEGTRELASGIPASSWYGCLASSAR